MAEAVLFLNEYDRSFTLEIDIRQSSITFSYCPEHSRFLIFFCPVSKQLTEEISRIE